MIYVHLGFPKTATTHLQKEIFHKIDKVSYLGKNYKGKNRIFDQMHNFIECRKNFTSHELNKLIHNIKNRKKKYPILISEENWMCAFNRNKNQFEIISQERKLKNLKFLLDKINEEYKIIIVKRDIKKSIMSFYSTANYLISKCFGHKYISFNFFLNQILSGKLEKKKYSLVFNTFNIKLINKYFSKEKINILQYDLLKNNYSIFLKKFFFLMNIKIQNDLINKKNFVTRKSAKKNEKYVIYYPKIYTKILIYFLKFFFQKNFTLKLNNFLYFEEILDDKLLNKVLIKLKIK